jgi:hypothetical protein
VQLIRLHNLGALSEGDGKGVNNGLAPKYGSKKQITQGQEPGLLVEAHCASYSNLVRLGGRALPQISSGGMPFFEPKSALDPFQRELLASVFRQTWSEIVPRGYRLPQSQEMRLQKEVSDRLCALAANGVMDPETLQALTLATVRLFPRKGRETVTKRLCFGKSSEGFVVEECGGEIVVRSAGFRAVYFKSSCGQRLILKRRTETDDYHLLTRAWQAANAKARELGWIV